ncbi:ribonuclease H-like domain-containing protein [Rhizophagus clarus]|uniref:Ribonuclease H-like domain-containing protein n=1 Tax=Rhizophagus clarus TaxID=94130 RepID=A0A8H3KUS8_9GLOM|nr:ribonuclease H-like domain-containing protein [Rhizophagus clarus]
MRLNPAYIPPSRTTLSGRILKEEALKDITKINKIFEQSENLTLSIDDGQVRLIIQFTILSSHVANKELDDGLRNMKISGGGLQSYRPMDCILKLEARTATLKFIIAASKNLIMMHIYFSFSIPGYGLKDSVNIGRLMDHGHRGNNSCLSLTQLRQFKLPFNLDYDSKTETPLSWWLTYEESTEMLLVSLAVKMFSITPSEAGCKRNFQFLMKWLFMEKKLHQKICDIARKFQLFDEFGELESSDRAPRSTSLNISPENSVPDNIEYGVDDLVLRFLNEEHRKCINQINSTQ